MQNGPQLPEGEEAASKCQLGSGHGAAPVVREDADLADGTGQADNKHRRDLAQ